MARFGVGAWRVKKKERPARKYRTGLHDGPLGKFVDSDREGVRLNYAGRSRVAVFNAKKKRRSEFLAKRKRKSAIEFLLRNQISFKTSDGKKIRILRHGFENIYIHEKGLKPRALVIVFVDGKKLFFYRSSGESSKQPGEWFPTRGPILNENRTGGETVYEAGWMTKMDGHPREGGKPYFPRWVNEINQRLKKEEPKLILHEQWGPRFLSKIKELFEVIPFTEKIDARY